MQILHEFFGELGSLGKSDPETIHTGTFEVRDIMSGRVIDTAVCTFTLLDFWFENGNKYNDFVDKRATFNNFVHPCIFLARSELMEDGKYKLTDICPLASI